MAFSRELHRDPDYASLPATIDEQLLVERVIKLRKGDLSVVKDIVVSMMRLVMGVVRDSYSNDDETIGEALLTLQESVINAATALHDNNIIPYVMHNVRMRLKDVRIEGLTSYSMSARRFREHLSKGQLIPRRNAISEERYDSDIERRYKVSRLRMKAIVDPHRDQDEFELRDSLDKMVRSHRQKTIIDLKLQEYTLKEIAEMLSISEATAMRDIHDLRERYTTEV